MPFLTHNVKWCQAMIISRIFDFFIFTGDFFEEWNEITPQIYIGKFEELMARGRVSC